MLRLASGYHPRMNLVTFAYVMAGIRSAIGLAPLVALGPVAKLFGFPDEQMNPTARLMARLFGIRNVALAGLLVGAARGWAQLPFVFLLNAAVDFSDVLAISVPLLRKQGLGRPAGTSLVLALGATTAFLVAWSQSR